MEVEIFRYLDDEAGNEVEYRVEGTVEDGAGVDQIVRTSDGHVLTEAEGVALFGPRVGGQWSDLEDALNSVAVDEYEAGRMDAGDHAYDASRGN